MTYDLLVFCQAPVTVASLHRSLEQQKSGLRIADGGIDLATHYGGLPIESTHGDGMLEDVPEWFATMAPIEAVKAAAAPPFARQILETAAQSYSLSVDRDDVSLAIAWTLAAGVGSAGDGVVFDPQHVEDEDDDGWHLPAAAWSRARRRRRALRRAGRDPEQPLSSTRPAFGDAFVHRELEGWRSSPFETRSNLRSERELDDEDTLRRILVESPPTTIEDLSFVLDLAWRSCSPVAARLFATSAPLLVVERHLVETVRMVGLPARLYARFLLESVGPVPPHLVARLTRAADPTMRDVVLDASG
ncbi:MAG TPA: hypothetical protein VM925_24450 [Labilithrix sp.]|nr:hypothetical protein [Labilithrix sp.]